MRHAETKSLLHANQSKHVLHGDHAYSWLIWSLEFFQYCDSVFPKPLHPPFIDSIFIIFSVSFLNLPNCIVLQKLGSEFGILQYRDVLGLDWIGWLQSCRQLVNVWNQIGKFCIWFKIDKTCRSNPIPSEIIRQKSSLNYPFQLRRALTKIPHEHVPKSHVITRTCDFGTCSCGVFVNHEQ